MEADNDRTQQPVIPATSNSGYVVVDAEANFDADSYEAIVDGETVPEVLVRFEPQFSSGAAPASMSAVCAANFSSASASTCMSSPVMTKGVKQRLRGAHDGPRKRDSVSCLDALAANGHGVPILRR
jgi:hypothetical protein